MTRYAELVAGMVIGAVLMFTFDPKSGRRRRARMRDQFVHQTHELEDLSLGALARARHLRNRTRGMVVETRSRLRREEVDDPVLEARVRTELGRSPIDTSGVAVSAEHGRVTLRGTASEVDMEDLVETVQDVPGVHDVINRLKARESA